MSRTRSGGFRRQPRIADQMTPELHACVERALAAERAGDAAAALEWHRAVPMYRRGRHPALLERLICLGEEPPPWVWARWIAYQAIRCEDGMTGRLTKVALREATESLHDDLLEKCYRDSGDPVRVLATVLGESWAYHQLAAHDFSALRSFVDEFASGRLAEHADLAREWAGSPMEGFQLGDHLPGARLQVRRADGGHWLELLDIGARACAPTGWVLGRLVRSGVDGALMFDMPPMEVPEAIAKQVAGGDDWWEAVCAAATVGYVRPSRFLREDYELTTDVQDLDLLRFGTEPRDLPRVLQQLREGRDEVKRAAYRVLRRAARGELDAADHAYVGAAVQNPGAFQDVRRTLTREEYANAWAAWSQIVTPPSRQRLLELARAAGAGSSGAAA